MCLIAVKCRSNRPDISALKYIPEEFKTEEICLEAVKNNSYALQHVNNQTEEICLEAIKKDGYCLRYVNNQTDKICLEAINKNINAFNLIENPSQEVINCYNLMNL